MDPNNPNDPMNRETSSHNTVVEDRRSGNGVTWFIVAVLIVAAGVLAYMYYGDSTNTTAQTPPTTIEGQSDSGRATTDQAPSSTPAPSDNSDAMAPSDSSSAPPAATDIATPPADTSAPAADAVPAPEAGQQGGDTIIWGEGN